MELIDNINFLLVNDLKRTIPTRKSILENPHTYFL